MEEATKILDIKGNETDAVLNQKDNTPLIQVTELPSEFKGYPQGTVISFEPLTLGELESLNTDPDLDSTYAVAMLLNAIHCNTLNAEDLYYWDVMYIGIQRKLQALGNTKGTIRRRCPKCGEIVSKTFDYTELDFKLMQAINLPMKLEVAGKQLEFKQLSMKDFLQIDTTEGELGVYARYISNLEYEEALPLVKNATGIDIKKLRFVDKQLDYGIKPFVVTCTNTVKNPQTGKQEVCNEEVVLEVKSPFEVVFPEDEFEGDTGFDVQYG